MMAPMRMAVMVISVVVTVMVTVVVMMVMMMTARAVVMVRLASDALQQQGSADQGDKGSAQKRQPRVNPIDCDVL